MHLGLVIYGSLNTISGGYLYDRKMVEYLRAQGDTVEVISLPWRNYPAHLTDNFHYRLPARLDAVIEDELNHPSLLVANRRKPGYPILSLVHNLRSSEDRPAGQNRFYRSIEKFYLNSVDGFIFNSPTTCASVMGLVKREKPYRIAAPGGDRLGSMQPEAIQESAIEPGALRLIFLANLTPLKGLHVLLKALGRLPADSFRLEVIGRLDLDSAYVNDLKSLIRSLGLSDLVRFNGLLDGPALIEKLTQAQVMVIPSYYEGFGIAILEGMAFGLPVIGSSAGAMPSLISDGENGYLIRAGDDEMLAQHLTDLAVDRQNLLRLSLNALHHFRSQPTWDQSMQHIREFLLNLVSQSSR